MLRTDQLTWFSASQSHPNGLLCVQQRHQPLLCSLGDSAAPCHSPWRLQEEASKSGSRWARISSRSGFSVMQSAPGRIWASLSSHLLTHKQLWLCSLFTVLVLNHSLQLTCLCPRVWLLAVLAATVVTDSQFILFWFGHMLLSSGSWLLLLILAQWQWCLLSVPETRAECLGHTSPTQSLGPY